MADRSTAMQDALRAFALEFPEAFEDTPWDSAPVTKVRKKIFVFFGTDDSPGIAVKLPESAELALNAPSATHRLRAGAARLGVRPPGPGRTARRTPARLGRGELPGRGAEDVGPPTRRGGYARRMTESSGPRVAVFAPSPALVCTFEYAADDGKDVDIALNVGGQGPWVARAVSALGATPVLVVPLGGDTGRAAYHLLTHEGLDLRAVDVQAAIACFVAERRHGERSCIRDARPGRSGWRGWTGRAARPRADPARQPGPPGSGRPRPR